MVSFAYRDDDHIDDDPVSHCSCCRFTNGTDLPSPAELTIKEIPLEAQRFSGSILKNWVELSACLKRFEGVIRKRWSKKTDKQRREILLKAWPEISRHHRPDFMGCRARKKPKAIPRSITTTKQNHAFLYPYINLEDLQQGHLLPTFLHSRGHALPESFIKTDLENAHRGHGWPSVPEEGETAMAFAGGRTPRKYGRLLVQKLGKTQQILRPTVAPITGLFLLEIQDGIYEFLMSCCRTILHDLNPAEWYLAPSLPASAAPQPDNRRGEWTSLPAIALQAPYSTPCQLDIDRLQDLVGAKRSAAEDHIWMLREDPGYFLDVLRDCCEHSEDPDQMQSNLDHAWKHVAGQMMSDAFCTFYCWDELHCSLARMRTIEYQIQRANPHKGRLAPYDEAIWAYLDTIIDKLIEIPLYALTRGVPMAPRIRAMSIMNTACSGRARWEMKTGRSDAEHRIFVLFWALFSEQQRNLHGLSKLIQEIQHTIDTDSAACDLLDPWIIERFSDIALMTEIQRGITSFQPWADGWRAHRVIEKSIMSIAVANLSNRDAAHLDVLNNAPCHAKIKSLGLPTDGRFYYPIDKKRTEQTTKEMRAAEKNLAAFWKDIADYFRGQTERGLFDEFHVHSCRTRGVHKTTAWVEPKATSFPTEPVTPVKTLPLQPLDPNAWNAKGTDNKKREIIDSAKARTKTRRDTTPVTPPAVPPEAIVDETENLPANERVPVKLPKRAYRVFATLLPSASSLAHVSKELAWDELLYAMNAVGLQPEKLYGSVWVFRPLPKERCLVRAERSIQFHEPKEVRKGSKIPPNMVRTFGRRLKYAYGWEATAFECE